MAAPSHPHRPGSDLRSPFLSLQSPHAQSMVHGAVDPPVSLMVLADAFIPIIDEVSALIVENGGPLYPPIWDNIPFPPSVSPKERAAAQHRAVAEGILRYRREVESPAEDILRERRASNPSAVQKLVAFSGEEASYYRALLEGIEPHVEVPDPAGVASIELRVSAEARNIFKEFHNGAAIGGADRNIIAIYAGPYRPTLPPPGFYLVYDSLANSLAAVPPLPHSAASQFTHRCVGTGVGVLRHNPPSEYVLAELLYRRNSWTQATLFTWCSSGVVAGQWINKEVMLPIPLQSDLDIFCADMVFAMGDRSLCWVDLIKGMLICQNVMAAVPEFRFIPLPQGCSRSWHPEHGRGRPKDFSSMSSVCSGVVKFVHIDPIRIVGRITLTTWTLSITKSKSEWKKDGSFRIVDIWNDSTYKRLKLPKKVPSCPDLSLCGEYGIIRLILFEPNNQYVFSVHMEHGIVVSGVRLLPGSRRFSRIIAIEVTMNKFSVLKLV